MKNILLLFSISIFISSCSSDSRSEGCTDPAAVNYQLYADYDNGSCDYTSDAVFWYDAITANELNAYSDFIYGPIDKLQFFINDYPIGTESRSPAFIYAGTPNCYQATYVTEQLIWSINNNATVNVRVEGIHEALLADLITVVDEFSFDVYANECAAVQIYFLSNKRKKSNLQHSLKPRSYLREH
jgi:hypothetical protein